MKISSLARIAIFSVAGCSLGSGNSEGTVRGAKYYFKRVATYPVCKLVEPNCNTTTKTLAEIVAVTEDGKTAVFTDSALLRLGFVNVTDPSSPKGLSKLSFATPGNPTGVALKGKYALASVETGTIPNTPSGYLAVVNMEDPANPFEVLAAKKDFGGQPDSIFVSPDKTYAAAVIENRRLEEGQLPTAPAGFILIFDISADNPVNWSLKWNVALAGLPGLRFDTDPEPEYASFNMNNILVVTLQENNAVVQINATDGKVLNSHHAGVVNLKNVDLLSDKMIVQTSNLDLRRREPDGVAWIGTSLYVTANEGDLDGGSRGFTIFNTDGNVVYESNMSAEHLITKFGHYNDARSNKKGVEFESVVYASDLNLIFVLSERSSVIMVYDVSVPSAPKFHQVLPSCVAPEGGSYNKLTQTLIVACETDDRAKKIRSSLAIYKYGSSTPLYPDMQSILQPSGLPIPWSALSGLSAKKGLSNTLFSVDDSAYKMSKIFTIDVSKKPAIITKALYIKDTGDVFKSFTPTNADFSSVEKAAMINADYTVNLDSEGIVATSDGFWISSEGGGTAPAVTSHNLLFKVNTTGVIQEVVTLPDSVNILQTQYGFEGITQYGDFLVVAFQRAWGTETHPRLGLYNVVTKNWKFVFYPLDAPTSQNTGGWVGLSDIVSVGGGKFLLVERDNQGGPDAAIKRIYSVSLGNLGAVVDGSTVTKLLVRDVLPDVSTAIGGLALEKIEGIAVLNGDIWINTDNDGLSDSSGESRLIKLGKVPK